MHSEILRYEADGPHMRSHLRVDPSSTDAQPGVLAFSEALGLGDPDFARGGVSTNNRFRGGIVLLDEISGQAN